MKTHRDEGALRASGTEQTHRVEINTIHFLAYNAARSYSGKEFILAYLIAYKVLNAVPWEVGWEGSASLKESSLPSASLPTSSSAASCAGRKGLSHFLHLDQSR